jgi:hypothetical protein
MRNKSDFDPDERYDSFPRGAERGYGPKEGFARWVRVNDPALFTAEALDDPTVRAFVDAPFTVNYAQFKSSTREAEYFIHKPVRAMSGGVEGIEGTVAGFPSDEPRLATLVVNHERSLAIHIHRSITIEDRHVAGQMIHKEEEGSPG